MYALTLHKPWAHAVAHLGKFVENRSWLPPQRVLGQRIAIHAGKAEHPEALRQLAELGFELGPHVQASAIICTVRVVGYVKPLGRARSKLGAYEAKGVSELVAATARDSCWWRGPVGWILRDVRVLPAAINIRGAQGLWRVPEHLVRMFQLEDDAREPTCGGRMQNGPGKAFARCSVCGRIDYERNEGDGCGQALNELQL